MKLSRSPHPLADFFNDSDSVNRAGKLVATLMGLLVAGALLAACATSTGDPIKDARNAKVNAVLAKAERVLGAFAMGALQNAAAHAVNGETADWASVTSAGLWASVGSLVSSEDLAGKIVQSAGPAAPTILRETGAQLSAIRTPAEANAAAVAIASGIDSKTVALVGP